MAMYQVQSNGIAPSGLVPGDYVNTRGGVYMIAAPGTLGSTFNPDSGYWSIRADPTAAAGTPAASQSMLSAAKSLSDYQTQTSQSFAREQMAFQQEANAQAMAFSADQAQKNRDWQEYMSNSAHQREVGDLITAGLNPILSVNKAGATTPSGASAAGVTSSGSSGSVDPGLTQLASNIYGMLIGAQTNIDIAKLQAATSAYMADRGYAGTTGAAGINAASNWSLQQSQQKHEEYMAQKYPQTWPGLLSDLINAVNDAHDAMLGDGTNSANSFYKLGKNAVNAVKIINKVVNYARENKN